MVYQLQPAVQLDKQFGDAFLRDICIESGIIYETSVSSALERKMYNGSVQVEKCIYEALLQLIWRQFIPLITSNHLDKLTHLETMKQDVEQMCESLKCGTVQEYLEQQRSDAVVQTLKYILGKSL